MQSNDKSHRVHQVLSSIEILHLPTHLSLHIPFADSISFIMCLFPSAKRNADLDQISFQIDKRRNQSHSLLVYLSLDPLYLLPMKQESSFPFGFMVVYASMHIGGDVETDEHESLRGDFQIAITEGESAHTNRFHLRPLKQYPTFEIFYDLIIEIGFFVLL